MHVWCVVELPVQWYAVVDILGVLLCLVGKYGGHDVFTIGLDIDK